jgi:hypothetical protein
MEPRHYIWWEVDDGAREVDGIG